MLKLLYQESPVIFETVINNLLQSDNQEWSVDVSPTFEQQVKKGGSVPDLCICQKSFQLFFETKIVDWFYPEQLKNHLNALTLDRASTNVLFLLTSEAEQDIWRRLEEVQELAKKERLYIQLITFEQLLQELDHIKPLTGSVFQATVEAFNIYLEENNYLPIWKYRLDVVNCGKTRQELEQGIYVCPHAKGAYSHKRAKYFGAYYDKKVNWVAEILAVIAVEKGGAKAAVKWNNTTQPNKQLETQAVEKLSACNDERVAESQQTELQMFLLGDKKIVSYEKSSRGGMMSSKRYIDKPFRGVRDIDELCQRIKEEKEWQ